MATGRDLKRKSTFLAPNGKIYEGTAANYYEGTAKIVGNNVGGTPEADRLPGKPEEVKEEEKE